MNKLWIIIMLFIGIACTKDNELTSEMETLCSLAPEGWQCELILSDFNPADIPQNAPSPYAILKYIHHDLRFEQIGGQLIHPSLVLNLYLHDQRSELLKVIDEQKMFSWCIPIYYGETDRFVVITSPCFINSGTYTDEANHAIEDLHQALEKFIEK